MSNSRHHVSAHRADRLKTNQTGERTGVKAEAAGGGGAQRQP
jgi:hypothetical protein